MNLTLSELGRTTDSAGTQGSTAGVFDPVIIPADPTVPGVGQVSDVPLDLQEHVMAGNLAWRYTTVDKDGRTVPALVVGAPATTTPVRSGSI